VTTPADIVRLRYTRLAERDFDGLSELLSEHITWHVPGHNPLAGTHHGRPAVLRVLRQLVKLTGGTSTVSTAALLSGADLVAVVEHGSARTATATIEIRNVSLFRVSKGRIQEMWFLPGDQYALDAFWAKAQETPL
jgi:uncharacterized protein